MKKFLYVLVVCLVLLCSTFSVLNFTATSAEASSAACYGKSQPDPGTPLGWKCVCQQFVDCWTAGD